jgi:DNA-binding response OmpR family regulator
VAVRVLLAEDDAALANAIARGLRREAVAVDVAPDGATAQEKLAVVDYDVLVLDRDLPVVHGDTVCAELSESASTTRILMLTASSALDERVEGFALGADDYMSKPFAMVELIARLRALARRSEPRKPVRLQWRDVWLDPARRSAGRGAQELRLANREFAVLEQLMMAEGAVMSAEQLMDRVWDDRLDPFSNAVRVTMLTLRRKLGAPPIIETLPGAGYRLR